MGEQGLVDLSFRDFCFIYEKCHLYETNIQVNSITRRDELKYLLFYVRCLCDRY